MAPVLFPTSLHSSGYPGDLKFPGRSDQYLFNFFVCIATGHDNNRIFLGLTSSVQQDLFLGTRMEVPPPFNFLMARGGGGEVKARQVGARGGGGVRGVEIFLPRSQGY